MKSTELILVAGAAILALSVPAFADALKGHPHLKAAHNKLENALKDLAAANDGKTEFGGHRDNAENLVKQALQEIEQAAEYANAHGGKKH